MNDCVAIIDNDGFLLVHKNGTFEKISSGKYLSVSCGYDHMMVIDEDGILWSRGHNEDGRLGLGDYIDRLDLVKVSDKKFIHVACGCDSSLAIDEDGCLWLCGTNSYLLTAFDGTSNVFVQVSDKKFITAACGYKHLMAIDDDGYLWGSGYNEYGQLGVNDKFLLDFKRLLDQKVSHISCGFHHSFVLDCEGYFWACGENFHGELGLGSVKNRFLFTKINCQNFKLIKCGYCFTIAIDNDGFLWACGTSPSNSDKKKVLNFVKFQDCKFIDFACNFKTAVAIDENSNLWMLCTKFNMAKIESINNVETLMNVQAKKKGMNTKGAHNRNEEPKRHV